MNPRGHVTAYLVLLTVLMNMNASAAGVRLRTVG